MTLNKQCATLKKSFSLDLGVIIIAVGFIVGAGLNDQIAKADLIVVPGNAIARDGTPSPRLKARLDAALWLYQEGYAR